ncbi:hypothetical protein PIB30_102272, partial [Stylosanthes scabra]|nr:hypothetical protein [Stylosanthes scabra]
MRTVSLCVVLLGEPFILPLSTSGAGFLGIFNDAGNHPVVAVEFDTFINKND